MLNDRQRLRSLDRAKRFALKRLLKNVPASLTEEEREEEKSRPPGPLVLVYIVMSRASQLIVVKNCRIYVLAYHSSCSQGIVQFIGVTSS